MKFFTKWLPFNVPLARLDESVGIVFENWGVWHSFVDAYSDFTEYEKWQTVKNICLNERKKIMK